MEPGQRVVSGLSCAAHLRRDKLHQNLGFLQPWASALPPPHFSAILPHALKLFISFDPQKKRDGGHWTYTMAGRWWIESCPTNLRARGDNDKSAFKTKTTSNAKADALCRSSDYGYLSLKSLSCNYLLLHLLHLFKYYISQRDRCNVYELSK